MSGPVAALVLSAGSSQRMGTPKPLVRLGGNTLAERSVDAAVAAGYEPVLLVAGAEYTRIGELLRSRPVEVVENPRWADGLSGSIRRGLEAIEEREPRADGVLLLAVDQPLVTPAHLRKLLHRWRASGAVAVVSAYGGTRGIPAVVGRDMFADLLQLEGDRGARDLLRMRELHIEEIPCPAAAHDVDTPEDLAEVSRMIEPGTEDDDER